MLIYNVKRNLERNKKINIKIVYYIFSQNESFIYFLIRCLELEKKL